MQYVNCRSVRAGVWLITICITNYISSQPSVKMFTLAGFCSFTEGFVFRPNITPIMRPNVGDGTGTGQQDRNS